MNDGTNSLFEVAFFPPTGRRKRGGFTIEDLTYKAGEPAGTSIELALLVTKDELKSRVLCDRATAIALRDALGEMLTAHKATAKHKPRIVPAKPESSEVARVKGHATVSLSLAKEPAFLGNLAIVTRRPKKARNPKDIGCWHVPKVLYGPVTARRIHALLDYALTPKPSIP